MENSAWPVVRALYLLPKTGIPEHKDLFLFLTFLPPAGKCQRVNRHGVFTVTIKKIEI